MIARKTAVGVGLVLGLVLPAPAAAARPEHIGAGCVIKVGEAIVMVRDVWSGRWSLPGGGAEADESAVATACRETEEETGLRVDARAHLGAAANGFRIYACAPHSGSIRMAAGDALELPPAARAEILQARLLDPAALPQAAWRFPRQRAQVVAMVRATAPLDVVRLERAPGARRPLVALELAAGRWLQGQARRAPVRLALEGAAGLGGALALALAVLWVWHARGWRQGAEVAFVLLFGCLAGCAVKQLCAWPRPCYLDPGLQRAAAAGFGFPSGHALAVVLVGGAIALTGPARHRRGGLAAAAALSLLCGVGRVYQGVHFPHDVLGALALGAALLAAYRALRRHLGVALVPLGLWLAAAPPLALAAAWWMPQPTPVAQASTLVGLAVGLWAWRPRSAGAAAEGGLARLAGIAALWAAAALAAQLGAPVQGSFGACLTHVVACNVGVGIAVPLGSRLGSRRASGRRRHGLRLPA